MSSHPISNKTRKCWACANYVARRDFKESFLSANISCDNEGSCSKPRRTAREIHVHENTECSDFILWGMIENFYLRKENEKELKEFDKERKNIEAEMLENQRLIEIENQRRLEEEERLEDESFANQFAEDDKNDKRHNRANYEKISEKVESYNRNDRVNELPYFGWELVKEFKYKNGDSRLTIQRNMNDVGYNCWKENEKLYRIVKYLCVVMTQINNAVKNLSVTYKELCQDPDYKLSGLKALFNIRSKEQKAEIRAKVDEINKGYQTFRRELGDDVHFVFSLGSPHDFSFGECLKADTRVIHPDAERIYEIVKKYNVEVIGDGDELRLHIKSITYDFKTKKVVLNS